MYRIQYATIQDESSDNLKVQEQEVLQRSIALLTRMSLPDAPPAAAAEAIYFTSRVWTTFLEDLAKPENALEPNVRASLISIGIWILKQLDAIRSGELELCQDVIEITEIIRNGLNRT